MGPGPAAAPPRAAWPVGRPAGERGRPGAAGGRRPGGGAGPRPCRAPRTLSPPGGWAAAAARPRPRLRPARGDGHITLPSGGRRAGPRPAGHCWWWWRWWRWWCGRVGSGFASYGKSVVLFPCAFRIALFRPYFLSPSLGSSRFCCLKSHPLR